MKIQLDYVIPIDVVESGKSIETFEVNYRELTSKEKKELKKTAKKFQELQKRLGKIERKSPLLKKKSEAYENMQQYDKQLEAIEALEALEAEFETALEEIEKVAGDDFMETEAKQKFNLLVSGKDVSKLEVQAEALGYVNIMQMLNEAKEGLLTKASKK